MSEREYSPAAAPLRRALDAERAAHRDVEQARIEARELVDAARARVREIERRTEERIGHVVRRARAETERRLARLIEQEHAALERLEQAPADTAAIERAAGQVARRLIGLGPDADGSAPGGEGD